ncbi:uncharacterized protein LOC133731510 [Rosa rugosa]|uniref:uncharacterized protein LOC133731510 n=1 Tax=Rosa rugosa TaxID=74645 RepID=UPI002B40C290|nr:uncharacterized protein LOC133731510 [Rosa rugosa]
MISCHTAATERLLPPSKSQSHFKRLKRSPDTPCQSLSKTDIHDLPDSVLVEILCRLPHNKFVFQCQCVCKRWFSLISDEKFHCRFLWLQSHNPKSTPTESTLIFRDAKSKRKYFILPEFELPMFRTRDFSLPRFGATDYIETSDDGPIVVGACNDLVLCCGDISYQCDYYICNPYTKQYVRLPPTPRCYREVRVGFICDQYYKEDVDDQKKEGITSSGIIQVDVDFRYAIVRICPRSPFKFNIEIFSSETGKWTESVIQSPQDGFLLDSLEDNGGIELIMESCIGGVLMTTLLLGWIPTPKITNALVFV